MKPASRFWPLDFDEEVEIYDNPSWDLPGRTRKRRADADDGAKALRLSAIRPD